MFKKLEDFIKDIKERDKDVPLLDCSNDKETFPEDFGCPSQPNNEEDKNEDEISSDKRCKKNFIEKFFQLQGFFPDDDDDEYI